MPLQKLLMRLVMLIGLLENRLGGTGRLYLPQFRELGMLSSSSLSESAPFLSRRSRSARTAQPWFIGDTCGGRKTDPDRWNFPAAMIARKVAPVIATGCTAVIKVPSETPYTNLAIMEVCAPLPATRYPRKPLMSARKTRRCPRWCLERHHYRSQPPRYR